MLERALSDYVRERDRETLFRFGNDTQVSATNFLALTEWHLGEFERARRAHRRGRPAAPANWVMPRLSPARSSSGPLLKAAAAMLRRRGLAVEVAARADGRAQSEDLHRPWSRCTRIGFAARQGDPEAGALGLRQALASYLALGNRSGAPSFYGLLAELEAMRPDLDSALATIDAGLAIAEETGEHYTDPYLHRLRGEFLLMRAPADSVRAEEAFQTAIAVAKRARRARLCAAGLALRSPSSTNRPAARIDAQADLAPALEGFSPTPEMPEIAEAQGLLRQLA